MIDRLSASVEKAKIKAIGSRNALNSIAKERQTRKQQLEAQIDDISMELQQLETYHESLLRRQAEMTDVIENLSSIHN